MGVQAVSLATRLGLSPGYLDESKLSDQLSSRASTPSSYHSPRLVTTRLTCADSGGDSAERRDSKESM